MVPPEAPYSDVYTDTFIFFLRSLCKIIWMNVHYFPNAPRTLIKKRFSLQVELSGAGRVVMESIRLIIYYADTEISVING